MNKKGDQNIKVKFYIVIVYYTSFHNQFRMTDLSFQRARQVLAR